MDIIDTLHPEGSLTDNLYPNIKNENIPDKAINYNRLADDVIALINSIVSLNPQVAASANILAFRENKGIYVGSDTGEWYYWNGTQYASGGEYQAIQLNDGSVTYRKTNFVTSVINSRNIYNKNDPDIYVGTSGSINGCWLINSTTGAVERNQWQMDGAYSVSYLIPVEPSTQYVFSDNGNTTSFLSVAFYDTNGNFISKANDWSSSITTPSNCYYIRINNQSLKTSNYQIEKGTTRTPYVPYNDAYKIVKLIIDNSNINDGAVSMNKTNFIEKKTGKNIYNAESTDNYIGTSNSAGGCWEINTSTGVVERNQWQMDGAYSVSYMIPVKPNTDYYFSKNGATQTAFRTAFYDVNGNFISMASEYSGNVTTPANCGFIRVNLIGITPENKFQVEENERTAYEPFYEYYTTIDDLKILETNVIKDENPNKFIIPDYIYMINEQPLRIYKESMIYPYKSALDYNMYLYSAEDSWFYVDNKNPYSKIGDIIDVNKNEIGSTLRIAFQKDIEEQFGKIVNVVSCSASSKTTSTAKINAFGDSLTFGGLTHAIHKTLTGLGISNSWIGTVQSGTNQLCEARAGYSYAQYIGYRTIENASDAHLDLFPFLKLATSDDKTNHPDWCFTRTFVAKEKTYAEVVAEGGNTNQDFYIFDYNYYLTHNNLDTPNIVLLSMGTNDRWKYGKDATSICEKAIQIITSQVHSVNANINIGIVPFPAQGNDDTFDLIRSWYLTLLSNKSTYNYDIICEFLSQGRNNSWNYNATTINGAVNKYTKSDDVHTYLNGYTEGGFPIAYWIVNKL